tara:strand:- start:112 stop:357 length:246 start_codon:yes stop_codon:yes gene_type:complete
MKTIQKNIRAFAVEEDGVALTEYLILLGLLVGGVIATVTLAGTSLNGAWATWSGFWDGLPGAGGGDTGGSTGGDTGGSTGG